MTSYVNRAQLESRFGQTEVAEAAWRDALDADIVIAAAINGAGDLIDGYLLGGGYALPLVPVPALVTEIALDITWYKLWKGPLPDEVERRHKDALRQLTDIQAGRIGLAGAGGAVQPATSDNQVLLEAGDLTFTRDSLGGF